MFTLTVLQCHDLLNGFTWNHFQFAFLQLIIQAIFRWGWVFVWLKGRILAQSLPCIDTENIYIYILDLKKSLGHRTHSCVQSWWSPLHCLYLGDHDDLLYTSITTIWHLVAYLHEHCHQNPPCQGWRIWDAFLCTPHSKITQDTLTLK